MYALHLLKIKVCLNEVLKKRSVKKNRASKKINY
jgi:hypothetical protein